MLMAFEGDRLRCHHVEFVTNQEHTGFEAPLQARADEELVGAPPELGADEEVVDGLPVLVDVRPIVPASTASLPAVQAAAAAATGFVAGAATIALLRRHSTRKLARTRIGNRRGPNGLPIVGSRSFLVDVHLIQKPGE